MQIISSMSRFFSVPRCAQTMEADFRALSIKVQGEVISTVHEMAIEVAARSLQMRLQNPTSIDNGEIDRRIVIKELIDVYKAIR